MVLRSQITCYSNPNANVDLLNFTANPVGPAERRPRQLHATEAGGRGRHGDAGASVTSRPIATSRGGGDVFKRCTRRAS